MQSKIFLSIELLPTFLAGIIEVGAVAHLLVLLELRLPLVALLALVALVRLVGAVHVLHVVVKPGVAGKVLGAQVTHEAVGRVVELSVALVVLEVLTGLLEGVQLARTFLVMITSPQSGD